MHCDVKPQNVMVVDWHQRPLMVKLVDFGAANSLTNMGDLIQTLWYTSPEVMVCCKHTEAIDVRWE